MNIFDGDDMSSFDGDDMSRFERNLPPKYSFVNAHPFLSGLTTPGGISLSAFGRYLVALRPIQAQVCFSYGHVATRIIQNSNAFLPQNSLLMKLMKQIDKLHIDSLANLNAMDRMFMEYWDNKPAPFCPKSVGTLCHFLDDVAKTGSYFETFAALGPITLISSQICKSLTNEWNGICSSWGVNPQVGWKWLELKASIGPSSGNSTTKIHAFLIDKLVRTTYEKQQASLTEKYGRDGFVKVFDSFYLHQLGLLDE